MRSPPILRLLLSSLLLWSSHAPAHDLPSQVDLRAAYCVAVMQAMLRWIAPDPATAPQRPDRFTQERAEIEANLRRLQRYLLPRLPSLAPSGLLTATQQGEEDATHREAWANRCAMRCVSLKHLEPPDAKKYVGCLRSCNDGDPILPRMRQCESLPWLPF